MNKNIKPFAGFQHGLIEIKLQQLKECSAIDEIILSTNDDEIIDFAESEDISKLVIHRRDDELCSSATSTDELITLASELANSKHILWTHVTSPFFSSEKYYEIIDSYFKAIERGFDSIVSVNLLQTFIWAEDGPVNYNREIEKWPRTQTLTPFYEINSGAFINSKENYLRGNDRIGDKPFLYISEEYSGFDIDWPEEFVLGEKILESGAAEI